jgi:hypothetical protein
VRFLASGAAAAAFWCARTKSAYLQKEIDTMHCSVQWCTDKLHFLRAEPFQFCAQKNRTLPQKTADAAHASTIAIYHRAIDQKASLVMNGRVSTAEFELILRSLPCISRFQRFLPWYVMLTNAGSCLLFDSIISRMLGCINVYESAVKVRTGLEIFCISEFCAQKTADFP